MKVPKTAAEAIAAGYVEIPGDPRDVVFPKGMQITCTNGHLVGVTKSDIWQGWVDVEARQLFSKMSGKPWGGSATVCDQCGEPWVRVSAFEPSSKLEIQVHTPEGWRPER